MNGSSLSLSHFFHQVNKIGQIIHARTALEVLKQWANYLDRQPPFPFWTEENVCRYSDWVAWRCTVETLHLVGLGWTTTGVGKVAGAPGTPIMLFSFNRFSTITMHFCISRCMVSRINLIYCCILLSGVCCAMRALLLNKNMEVRMTGMLFKVTKTKYSKCNQFI